MAGFRFAVLQAALHPRNTLPPPRRVGLRFPTPVGHGRGLASRTGSADPLPSSFTSFGCGSAKPLPALPLATGLAFTRFALAASRYLRRASLPLRAACVRSSSPGFTHARRHAAGFLPPLRQPAAARHRSRLSLSASGSSVSNQAGLLQNNIAAISIGVNRPGCVPCRAGSRLGFYRSPATAMRSSHRLFAARFRSLPGETRLTKGFCPFPPPIRQ